MTLSTIDEIRSSRDVALRALGAALDAVGREIETPSTGADLGTLAEREQALMDEREAIRAAATDLVLALPAVIGAAEALSDIATGMLAEAMVLPHATDVLASTGKILTFGQNFVNTIASARNS